MNNVTADSFDFSGVDRPGKTKAVRGEYSVELREDSGAINYRRFLGGDENGLAEIIKEYKDGLTFYINSFTRDIFAAEELMEETFVRLVVRKPRYTAKYAFKTWLYTIGRNIALDYLRRSVRKADMTDGIMQKALIEEESVERAYLREERRIVLHRALSKINEVYRRALYLKYFEDMSNADIAMLMKKSGRQTENIIYRAKGALKTQLEKEGFEYEEL